MKFNKSEIFEGLDFIWSEHFGRFQRNIWEKMYLLIIFKVPKNKRFTPSLKNTILENSQRGREEEIKKLNIVSRLFFRIQKNLELLCIKRTLSFGWLLYIFEPRYIMSVNNVYLRRNWLSNHKDVRKISLILTKCHSFFPYHKYIRDQKETTTRRRKQEQKQQQEEKIQSMKCNKTGQKKLYCCSP